MPLRVAGGLPLMLLVLGLVEAAAAWRSAATARPALGLVAAAIVGNRSAGVAAWSIAGGLPLMLVLGLVEAAAITGNAAAIDGDLGNALAKLPAVEASAITSNR